MASQPRGTQEYTQPDLDQTELEQLHVEQPGQQGRRALSRRDVLAGGAVVAGSLGLAGCAGAATKATGESAAASTAGSAVGAATSPSTATASTMASEASAAETPDPTVTDMNSAIVPFDGEHQAGIEGTHQRHLNLVGLRLKDGIGKRGIRNLMRLWTEDARALCTGETPAGSLEPEMVTTPASLTITCGWGEAFFEQADIAKPEWLGDVRKYSRDELRPEWGQTDVVLQICADNITTAAHALRHMVRSGVDYAEVAWVQQGFVNAERGTARNLFGQVDGTVNPRTHEEFNDQVWIESGDFSGGSAMVVRRIAMNMDTWEEVDRAGREIAIGRTLSNGAPLGGKEENDPVDLEARDKYGLKVIDPNSHVARAHHETQKILRRPYNYDLAPEPGQLSNSGQVFICFQKNPREQFEPIQARLDEADQLNTWITHIGSAMYFIPAGTQSGSYWGKSLLEG